MPRRGSSGSFLGGAELELGVPEPEEEGSLEAAVNHRKPAPSAHGTLNTTSVSQALLSAGDTEGRYALQLL